MAYSSPLMTPIFIKPQPDEAERTIGLAVPKDVPERPSGGLTCSA